MPALRRRRTSQEEARLLEDRRRELELARRIIEGEADERDEIARREAGGELTGAQAADEHRKAEERVRRQRSDVDRLERLVAALEAQVSDAHRAEALEQYIDAAAGASDAPGPPPRRAGSSRPP